MLGHQIDRSNSFVNIQAQGDRRLSIGAVNVIIVAALQSGMADCTDATRSVHADTYIVRQSDGRLPHSSLNSGLQVLLPISAEVHGYLAGSHVDLQASERETP